MSKRKTKQKDIILKLLRSTDAHPTASEVYMKARKVMPHISLGTVYRNLRILREEGEIQDLNYSSQEGHFDGNPREHPHFVCKDCKRVMDIEDLYLDDYVIQRAEEILGAEITHHRVEFYGRCAKCKEKK